MSLNNLDKTNKSASFEATEDHNIENIENVEKKYQDQDDKISVDLAETSFLLSSLNDNKRIVAPSATKTNLNTDISHETLLSNGKLQVPYFF